MLSVNPGRAAGGDHGEVPGADIALHLARHGVRAEAATAVAEGVGVADMILARVSDLGADLIVAGATATRAPANGCSAGSPSR